MRLLEPTAQIWMKIDPYYQRQKCRPMNLVSENIRFMPIFAGVPLGAGVKRHWRLSTTAIFWLFSWLRLQKRQRYGKQYYMTICYPLSTGKWMQNEWPWITLSGYFMTKCVFGQHFLNQRHWSLLAHTGAIQIRLLLLLLLSERLNVRNSTTSAILRCSVYFTIYMYLYLYSCRRETARQLRMYAQLTRCFSAVAELLV